MFIEAVQRRLMTVEQLAHEVLDGPRRGRRMLLAALEDAASGVWSVPESDLIKGLARSLVLPEAWPNPVLTAPDGRSLVSPDCWFDEVALAVMVHSRTHHQREDDFEATIESDGDLQAHGATVIGVTPRSIARNMAAIVTRTEQTYLQLVRRGARPDIRAVPRQAGVRVAGPVADGVTGSRRS